jgi:hypothetical protein
VNQVQATADVTNLCNLTDANEWHVFRSNGELSGKCALVSLLAFAKLDVSEMSPLVALTYDATLVLAHGLQHLSILGLPQTGSNLRSAIINNVSFEGASG